MFQTFLSIALPALVTFTTALFLLHRAAMEERGSHRPSPPRPEFRPHSGTAPNRKPRASPPPASGANASRGPAGENTVPSKRTGASSESSRECVLCFEKTKHVQLYFCHSRCLCEDCAHRISSSSRPICPFCHTIISRGGNSY